VACPKREKIREEVGGWFLVSITLQRYIGVSLDTKVKEERRVCVSHTMALPFTLKRVS
jgi:hypothetical protein